MSTSRKIKTRSKIPVRSKLGLASDKDLPKITEINSLSVSVKPTKLVSRSLQVDGKMEENRLKLPVNNEESILGKSSDGMKKTNDVENDAYQRRNAACYVSQASCDVTQRCKLKIQQRDNANSVVVKSETNAQDYLSEARDNYEQSLSSAVANQPFILRYPSETPDNHQQNWSSTVTNLPLIIGYPSVTPDNHQQNSLSAVINQPLILGFSSATPDNCQQCSSLAVAYQPLVLAPFILGTCQVLIPYRCSKPTHSMLI